MAHPTTTCPPQTHGDVDGGVAGAESVSVLPWGTDALQMPFPEDRPVDRQCIARLPDERDSDTHTVAAAPAVCIELRGRPPFGTTNEESQRFVDEAAARAKLVLASRARHMRAVTHFLPGSIRLDAGSARSQQGVSSRDHAEDPGLAGTSLDRSMRGTHLGSSSGWPTGDRRGAHALDAQHSTQEPAASTAGIRLATPPQGNSPRPES